MTTPYDVGYEDGASGLDSNNVFDGDTTYNDGYDKGRTDYLEVIARDSGGVDNVN